jgi:quercetin dioxygenase-like cupin family protein
LDRLLQAVPERAIGGGDFRLSNAEVENGERMNKTSAPTALHRGTEELPFADLGGGLWLQLAMVDLPNGLWVMRIRLDPGTVLLRHRHTGPVHAFTVSGRWRYLEYDDVNLPGSYLYEPAQSVHTLEAPGDNDAVTEVCFSILGSNLNLNDENEIVSIDNATSILKLYRMRCEEQDLPSPNVIVSV